jgi:hypothetical protein
MTVTEAIKVFLEKTKLSANADLIARWSPAMECQINVAAGEGEPVEGRRSTWTDGINTWWSIRIPKNANAEPSWQDYELTFPFELHAEGIGLTGWNWQDRKSLWVAFDVDSLVSHAKGIGITDEELEKVKQATSALPYVETRKSTGGGGLHLYVYLDGIPTANHTEHAALARCILGMMSNETGFDFASQIDACGSIMWFWARKMTTENHGLEILKPSTKILSISDLPANWRDHIEVVTKKRSKVRVNEVADDGMDEFERLASSRKIIPLDDSHKAQVEALMRSGFTTLWITDHHLLQTHTCALRKIMADKELKLIGYFETISEGKDPGTPNAFLFPLLNGGWKVYRFSPGITEAPSWTQDGAGWTTTFFNRQPDLGIAAKAYGGVEDADKVGQYVFEEMSQAIKAAATLGQEINPINDMDRETRLKTTKDGRLTMEITKKDEDEKMPGWLEKKNKWIRIFDVKLDTKKNEELGFNAYDNLIRELIAQSRETAGWVIFKDGVWVHEPINHVKLLLQNLGNDKGEAENIMGGIVNKSWRLVDLPFHEEYPGGRQWNKDAAQLKIQPANLEDDEKPSHPHWDKILNHVGQELNAALRDSPWAQRAGIKTGADYLLAWIASVIKYPFEPLPYLFLWGPEDSGKSIFHEAISECLFTRGCVFADRALTSSNDFNGELANCIVAVIEEKDISKAKGAHNKIKSWVTARKLSIRRMRTDAYEKPNTTHWIQCANHRQNCPIFPGDTRITVLHVPDLMEMIPKKTLMPRLIDETPHFLYTLMNTLLPEPSDRLNIPVVVTESKTLSEEANRSVLQQFIDDSCQDAPGVLTLFRDFFNTFYESLTINEKDEWTTSRVLRELPPNHAISNENGNKYVTNLTLPGD